MSVPDAVTGGLVVFGVQEIYKEVKALAMALSGHESESVGEVLGKMGHRHLQNAQRTMEKTALISLGIWQTPRDIPLTIGQSILEGASLEENEEMRERWANMLANAADPRQCNPVLVVFPGMLKMLSSREVKFLDHLSEHRTIRRGLAERELEEEYKIAKLTLWDSPQPVPHFQNTPILDERDATNLQVSLDILMAARILSLNKNVLTMLSPLGWALLNACQPPQKS